MAFVIYCQAFSLVFSTGEGLEKAAFLQEKEGTEDGMTFLEALLPCVVLCLGPGEACQMTWTVMLFTEGTGRQKGGLTTPCKSHTTCELSEDSTESVV